MNNIENTSQSVTSAINSDYSVKVESRRCIDAHEERQLALSSSSGLDNRSELPVDNAEFKLEPFVEQFNGVITVRPVDQDFRPSENNQKVPYVAQNQNVYIQPTTCVSYIGNDIKESTVPPVVNTLVTLVNNKNLISSKFEVLRLPISSSSLSVTYEESKNSLQILSSDVEMSLPEVFRSPVNYASHNHSHDNNVIHYYSSYQNDDAVRMHRNEPQQVFGAHDSCTADDLNSTAATCSPSKFVKSLPTVVNSPLNNYIIIEPQMNYLREVKEKGSISTTQCHNDNDVIEYIRNTQDCNIESTRCPDNDNVFLITHVESLSTQQCPNGRNIVNFITVSPDSDDMSTPCPSNKKSHSVDVYQNSETCCAPDYGSLPINVEQFVAESDEILSQTQCSEFLREPSGNAGPLRSITCLHTCADCNKHFSTRHGLQRHSLTHADDALGLRSDESITNYLLNLHSRIHSGERTYTCLQCDKQFITELGLKEHALIHTGESPYTCLLCNNRFITRRGLQEHSLSHSGERPYPCLQCDKQFKTKQRLEEHTLSHTAERLPTCLKSDKQFKTKKSLQIHALSHTGERPYACLECYKQFKTKGNFKQHAVSHTGETPYACLQCDKQFKRKQALNTHCLVHTDENPFTCLQCNKQFKTKMCLKTHVPSHTDERPYACSVINSS